LVDTFLPGGIGPSGDGRPYPSASAVGVDRDVAELVAALPEAQRREFGSLLRAIDSPFTNLLLTGRPRRFTRLSPAEREEYLRGWSRSTLAVKRRGFQAAKRLAAWFYFSSVPRDGHPPLWDRIHYLPPPQPPPVDLGPTMVPLVPDRDEDLTTDVCVVGSGAGGSVIAARLAAAGYRVTVLESGAWVPGLAYPRGEREGFDRLYYGRGIVTSRDSAIAVLAGETPGGGTSVNWMTCLPPRPEAREEWVRDGGMEGADGPEFDRALAAVSTRIGVSREESDVNPSNDALRRGCQALGYAQGRDWDILPRNAVGCGGRCGFCGFGCPYPARQSTLTTFLADALSAGARLYCSTRAELIELRGGRATGVRATYRGPGQTRDIHIASRAVVLAGGALQTPVLLLRSGVTFPGVGRGLRLDPTTAMVGEFPQPVRPWDGPPQTVGVYRFQSTDPGAHGPWLEVAPAHPGLAALATPWSGATDFLRLMERIEFVATPIVLVRDSGEGRVTSDSHGRPVLDYELTTSDRGNLLRGLSETARILVAAGATRLLSLTTPYIEIGDGSRPVSTHERDRFISALERAGVRTHSAALFSAHPMGSARAGVDPRRSAARPTGEVHGIDGLWIGDGSLLPSAPGANPMLSILACAWRTADHLIANLAGRSLRPAGV
jgi:choline dehydrogenase-like flavoprotein